MDWGILLVERIVSIIICQKFVVQISTCVSISLVSAIDFPCVLCLQSMAHVANMISVI